MTSTAMSGVKEYLKPCAYKRSESASADDGVLFA
jgi:hypothetical protein